MKFEDIDIKFISVKKNVPEGPLFRFEKKPGVFIYPEKYHTLAKQGGYYYNNTLRVYNQDPFKYYYYPEIVNDHNSLSRIWYPEGTYMKDGYCKIIYPDGNYVKEGFCIITYPDGTFIEIKDPQVVLKHLKYHMKHVLINKEYPSDYIEVYKQHFESIRNNRINNELPNTREKITISELLNESIKKGS